MEPNPTWTKKLILVVDDEPLNVKMLRTVLSREGYRILEVSNGKEALQKVKINPDLILMDIMMPDLNGFETYAILKEDESVKDIPVIFLSALMDLKTKVSGLNLGGVDFVSKPFQFEELLARIRTHLTIREQKQQLQDYALRLEEKVEERTRQLLHADRLATLGTLVAAVVHEVQNPLHSIMGNAEIAQLDLKDLSKALTSPKIPLSPEAPQTLVNRIDEEIADILKGCERLTAIIQRIKNFGKKQSGKWEAFPLRLSVQDALEIMRPRIKSSVAVEVGIDPDVTVWGNRQELSQVFINLIHNSLDALVGKEGRISITDESSRDHEVTIHFQDSGPGIPDIIEKSIFEPFFTTKESSHGTGLGLFVTRGIIEKHQGHIQMVPHQGSGTLFRIILPRPPDPVGEKEQ